MKSSTLRRLVVLASFTSTLACAAGAPVQPAPSAEKQKLVQRALSLWHIEDTAIAMTQRPAADALQQARIALQGRVTAAKQEATLKSMAADVQKYIDEATPVVRDNALRLKEPVLGPLLAQNFTEDKLRQLIARTGEI